MSAGEGVVFALVRRREWVKTVQLSVSIENIASSCKDFVSVSLMPYIPHNAVVGSRKDIMEGYGKLRYAE
jgi:hypothetical protein